MRKDGRKPQPLGISYFGPMACFKGKKLTLPQDLYRFITRAMTEFRVKDVVITIHAVEAGVESIWSFMEKLGGGNVD